MFFVWIRSLYGSLCLTAAKLKFLVCAYVHVIIYNKMLTSRLGCYCYFSADRKSIQLLVYFLIYKPSDILITKNSSTVFIVNEDI